MTVLRIYDPDECDQRGVPLDWERCRTCDGNGKKFSQPGVEIAAVGPPGGPTWHESKPLPRRAWPCVRCNGHGSLRAAALVRLLEDGRAHDWRTVRITPTPITIRCENCGHPRSEGTWDGADTLVPQALFKDGVPDHFWRNVMDGDFTFNPYVHFSPCDEGCRHGDPLRWRASATAPWHVHTTNCGPEVLPGDSAGGGVRCGREVEASWRAVDVRTLGWPHDLRPERLAVLCLRCLAARVPATT